MTDGRLARLIAAVSHWSVIPTGAFHSRREWEAEWRDLLFLGAKSLLKNTLAKFARKKWPATVWRAIIF